MHPRGAIGLGQTASSALLAQQTPVGTGNFLKCLVFPSHAPVGWGLFSFHYSVNWVNTLWPMIAAACLTLAAMHVLVWLQDRKSWASLIFSALAVCVAAIAAFELAMMRAQTPAQFGSLGRWIHVPVFLGIVSIVLWVRVYFGTGRPWLGWTLCGLRLASLVINFFCAVNINYGGIVRLRQLRFLGGTVSVAQGTANPWSRLPEFTLLLLVTFVADASVKLWRHGSSEERRRALVIGGSLTLFLLLAGSRAILVHEGMLALPYLVSVPFLFMVAAMSYDLSRDVLRAAQLARDLRESHQRLDLAASAADLGQWVWDFGRDEIWATAKGLELFGFPSSESLNFQRFLNSLHPEDREPVCHAVFSLPATTRAMTSRSRGVSISSRRWMDARSSRSF